MGGNLLHIEDGRGGHRNFETKISDSDRQFTVRTLGRREREAENERNGTERGGRRKRRKKLRWKDPAAAAEAATMMLAGDAIGGTREL